MNRFEQPLIRVENLGKVFSTERIDTHALSDVSFDIRSGEYVSICGPSGCGKSTLLSILGLLDTASSGGYWLNGRSTVDFHADERARIRSREIGFVFQAFNLISHLNVAENVALPLFYQKCSSSERRKRAAEMLERVGMEHRSSHYPHQLSGGQQQRVAVARALVIKPLLLLADEPTGNLDSANGQAVMDLLAELHGEGTTICMVTHDPRYVENSDRTLELFDGRIRSADIGRQNPDEELLEAV